MEAVGDRTHADPQRLLAVPGAHSVWVSLVRSGPGASWLDCLGHRTYRMFCSHSRREYGYRELCRARRRRITKAQREQTIDAGAANGGRPLWKGR